METSCIAQHSTTSELAHSNCCSTCNTDQHLGCRYHLILKPIIKVVHHAVPETTRKTLKTDLHYCDLQWLPLDAVLCMCDWLKLAVDLFSKTTGAMLLQDGLDEEDMQVISQAREWPCQAAARAAHHCSLYVFSLPCVTFGSVFVDHALRAASRPGGVTPTVSMLLVLYRMQHVVYACVAKTCQCVRMSVRVRCSSLLVIHKQSSCHCIQCFTCCSRITSAAGTTLEMFYALCSSQDFATGTSSP